MGEVQKPGSLVIRVQAGADCSLYSGLPASRKYHIAFVRENMLPPASVTQKGQYTQYLYCDLPHGAYHCGVSMEGYTSQCRIIHYTPEKAATGTLIDVLLSPLAGGGYEAGFVMCNTQEFMDRCLISQKDTWGQQYAHLFHTPQFSRQPGMPGHHKLTTNEEMWEFIHRLQNTKKNIYVYTLGKSPKYGYDIPLVLFTRENVEGMSLEQAASLLRNNGKPTVQYMAQVHGNEPASAEGALAMMLSLTGDYGEKVLNNVDVYIVPRINHDGAREVIRQSPTTGEDMNRDYLYMNNREIRTVTAAYNLFLPEVAIDGHEKMSDILTGDSSRCTDMELQVGAGSLNHPAVMTELAMEMALLAIEKGRSLGLRSHFYSNLASAAGGCAGSSYYGTRNSLAFLVETPGGTTLGNYCMARRVMAHYVLASTVISYTAENAQKVMETVHSSREKVARMGESYDESNLFVLEHGNMQTGSIPTPLMNLLTGQVTEPAFDIPYHEQPVAVRTRPRPTAYLIPKGLASEEEILRVVENHGIPYESLEAGTIVNLRQYLLQDEMVTLGEEAPVRFDRGGYVFANTVPSAILSVIMEPDFGQKSGRKMTLLSMGLISADDTGHLPIYRYCRDLTEGKITI